MLSFANSDVVEGAHFKPTKVAVQGSLAKTIYQEMQAQKIPQASANVFAFEDLYAHCVPNEDGPTEKQFPCRNKSSYEIRIYAKNKLTFRLGDVDKIKNIKARALYRLLLDAANPKSLDWGALGQASMINYEEPGVTYKYTALRVSFDSTKSGDSAYTLSGVIQGDDTVVYRADFYKDHPSWANTDSVPVPR
jgi:hypothetical protein